MSVQKRSARHVLDRCRQHSKRVIGGGPLFAFERDLVADVEGVVPNEAEESLPRLIADLAAGRGAGSYTSRALADMTASPVPAWHLISPRPYLAGIVQYSRGCPNECEFCNVSSLLGARVRFKSVAQVIAELDAVQAHGGFRYVVFADDNLTADPIRLREKLLPELIAWQRAHGPVSFFAQVTLDLADDEPLVAMMREAGFDTVFVGLETSDDEGLKECGKRPNRGCSMLNRIHCLQRWGLEVQGAFLVGFDSDRPDAFERQLEFIQSAGIAVSLVGLLQALPETLLFDRLRVENRVNGAPRWNSLDGDTNIVPRMGLDALRVGYRKLWRDLYSAENYFARVRSFMERSPLTRPQAVPAAAFGAGLFRALWRIGIVDGERGPFWRTVVWALLRKPSTFPDVLRAAVTGYHLRLWAKRLSVDHRSC